MNTFVILIQDDVNALKFELAMKEHNIDFNMEIIEHELDFIYEFTLHSTEEDIFFIIKSKNISVLEFTSHYKI
jgi:hypothetical protein